MSTAIAPRPWDLRHLQQFLSACPPPKSDKNRNGVASPPKSNTAGHDDEHQIPDVDGLGDFSKIYQQLGIPAFSAANSRLVTIPAKDDYASDGAMYQNSLPSRERASSTSSLDEMDDVEAVFTFDQSDGVTTPRTNVANIQDKKNRKKSRREVGKAVRTAQCNIQSESECDGKFGRQTPARKASSHVMMTRSMNAKLQTDYAASTEQAVRAVAEATARLMRGDDALPDTPCPTKSTTRVAKSDAQPISDFSKFVNEDELLPAEILVPNQAYRSTSPVTAAKRQNGPPYIVKTHNLIPSSILPKNANGRPFTAETRNFLSSSTQQSKNNSTAFSVDQHATPPRVAKIAASTPTIEPITIRSGEDRELALFFKILQDFGQDRKHLVKPANLTTHNSDPAGIHVFVDASNIFIGFVDQLKRARNIHPLQRVPDVNLSFDSLALLIERRRPVAKRVLVGSTPHIPAFDKARAVGYEVSVLDKVMKARELSERQIYFKEMDARRSGRKSSTRPPPHKIALEGSVLTPGGSETTTAPEPQYAPMRLVEQGVDEVLHVKMMESIIDYKKPGIMVLATGDAAQAEYSSGFMAMVERALREGWHVELISWTKNVSSLYRHKDWAAAWGERFRIIELDAYAEELLDM